jgi:hypothetical protein
MPGIASFSRLYVKIPFVSVHPSRFTDIPHIYSITLLTGEE